LCLSEVAAPIIRVLSELDIGVFRDLCYHVGAGARNGRGVEDGTDRNRGPEAAVIQDVLNIVNETKRRNKYTREECERRHQIEDYLVRAVHIDGPGAVFHYALRSW